MPYAQRPSGRAAVLVAGLLLVCLLALTSAAQSARAADGPGLRRALDRSLAAAKAKYATAYVHDLTDGRVLYERGPDVPRTPASVQKLFTTAAALRREGADARLVTRVVSEALPGPSGRIAGNLVLVGGGDPTLDAAALRRLARAVRRAGVRRVDGSVLGDESRFDLLRGGPRTGGAYDPDIGGVLGALTVGRGFARGAGPGLAAARLLARTLRTSGVRVSGRTATGTTPADASELARVRSPRLAAIAERTNAPSDNFYAEVLLKGLGAADGRPGTTDRGTAVVRAELRRLGVEHGRIVDGSGLSRGNRVSARQVVALLRAMHGAPQGPEFEASLAVAGVSGTLRNRMRRTRAAGACRGKTGTLNRVSTLAGLCRTAEGHVVAFAMLMNDATVWRAHRAQDRATSSIAAYLSAPAG
ncbi:MAG: D-alanyl-D-alanine carboxypeptidase/D-alanyl-D-alanine-endopeptidase [Solirubrobacteraceae bacterium]|nr:D-alanyl-D-alanine carboxypeptidase/D-alanyl-D-alanine-endopeptidase [Solirubrobacteraceae bacterium]